MSLDTVMFLLGGLMTTGSAFFINGGGGAFFTGSGFTGDGVGFTVCCPEEEDIDERNVFTALRTNPSSSFNITGIL